MVEYVRLVQSLKVTAQEKVLSVLDKANQYKYRLVETLGEQEFNNQFKIYTERYKRLNIKK